MLELGSVKIKCKKTALFVMNCIYKVENIAIILYNYLGLTK